MNVINGVRLRDVTKEAHHGKEIKTSLHFLLLYYNGEMLDAVDFLVAQLYERKETLGVDQKLLLFIFSFCTCSHGYSEPEAESRKIQIPAHFTRRPTNLSPKMNENSSLRAIMVKQKYSEIKQRFANVAVTVLTIQTNDNRCHKLFSFLL